MNEAIFSRRNALQALGGVALMAGVCTNASIAAKTATAPTAAEKSLAEIEAASGGRLGVFAIDTVDGRTLARNADRRFGMCSTFKLLLAAAILREIDAGRIDPGKFIAYGKADLLSHAPVTALNLAKGGMTVIALAEAAQLTSDNTAANLLLTLLGGPRAFTKLLRAMGDPVTRLDRFETVMNLVPPGEIRDTTTPRAMAQTSGRVLTGNVLTPASRAKLIDWMIATQTGLRRIRAGLPDGWRAGDKTGTAMHRSMHNKHNDVAIIFPASAASPQRAPIVVAACFEAARYVEKTRAEDDAVLASVGKVIATWAIAS